MTLKNASLLLILAAFFTTISCNDSEVKEATADGISNTKSVALENATLQGTELIKTDFGDIQLNEDFRRIVFWVIHSV